MVNGGICDLNYVSSKTRRGRVQGGGTISPTLTAENQPYRIEKENMTYRIRRLTPRECWRLQSFSDEDFDKAAQVCSPTQLYKQAGNSICEENLKLIFLKLIYGEEPKIVKESK